MIENNANTVLAMERIYFEDPTEWEDYLFDSTEYAMELERRNPVLEGVVERLQQLGVQVGEEDKKTIVKELHARYIDMGIKDGIPKAVKNWLAGTPVNPAYRENLYNLCLSLGMNEDETRVFFLKRYMTIPFNYKNRIDAVYYFGIRHGRNYLQIRDLLLEADVLDFEDARDTVLTQEVCQDITEIEDDKIFMEYLRVHSFGKHTQFQTANNELEELGRKNAQLATVERRLKHYLTRDKRREDGSSYDELKLIKQGKENEHVDYKLLLYIIYGFDNQERYKQKKTKIAKCEYLPKMFRENFPNDQEFARISMRDASPEVYRKALVIMKFYNFFCSGMINFLYGKSNPEDDESVINTMDEYLDRDPDEINEDLDDFYYETSALLAKCGFVQLYARNPFDWLILYCAKSTDPMDTLRELLTVRYTDPLIPDERDI